MKQRPSVIIKTAMTLDGYIDDNSNKRLIISNEKDFDDVEKIRESCDAILVGAETIRKDNPRLILKSGKKLTKVTITSSGNIDPQSNFFTMGDSEKIVYTTNTGADKLTTPNSSTKIISLGETVVIKNVLEDLFEKGVRRLLVEGGSTIITEFLNENCVDELQISLASFVLGNPEGVPFIKPALLQSSVSLTLQSIKTRDNMVVFSYLPNKQYDTKWITHVINLSKNCTPSDTDFAVGAALIDNNGELIADGYSRELGEKMHAEEVVLEKIKNKQIDLTQTTLYSSLEPCNERLSKPESCVDLIIKYGIPRIVFTAKEPPIFVQGEGAKRLQQEGKKVIFLNEFENEVIKQQNPLIQKQWQSKQ